MTISTTCAKCGAAFDATREEVLAGPDWRFCPTCRNAKSHHHHTRSIR